jgi:hypothetical protein
MKKIRMSFVFWSLLILMLPSCQDLTGVGDGTGEEWAIYRLADPSIRSDQLQTTSLSDLVLAGTPFISVKDVRAYHWKTHALECSARTDSLIDSLARYGGTTSGVPFVVTVGTEPIYLGTFWWGYSSMTPGYPYMEVISPRHWEISLPRLHQGEDPRSDSRIYHALKSAGVLIDD